MLKLVIHTRTHTRTHTHEQCVQQVWGVAAQRERAFAVERLKMISYTVVHWVAAGGCVFCTRLPRDIQVVVAARRASAGPAFSVLGVPCTAAGLVRF